MLGSVKSPLKRRVKGHVRQREKRAQERTVRVRWPLVDPTPLANSVAQVDDESRAALERDVVAKWQAFVEDGALTLQVGIVVATARK